MLCGIDGIAGEFKRSCDKMESQLVEAEKQVSQKGALLQVAKEQNTTFQTTIGTLMNQLTLARNAAKQAKDSAMTDVAAKDIEVRALRRTVLAFVAERDAADLRGLQEEWKKTEDGRRLKVQVEQLRASGYLPAVEDDKVVVPCTPPQGHSETPTISASPPSVSAYEHPPASSSPSSRYSKPFSNCLSLSPSSSELTSVTSSYAPSTSTSTSSHSSQSGSEYIPSSTSTSLSGSMSSIGSATTAPSHASTSRPRKGRSTASPAPSSQSTNRRSARFQPYP